jgi:hypothetical protein
MLLKKVGLGQLIKRDDISEQNAIALVIRLAFSNKYYRTMAYVKHTTSPVPG